MSLTMFLAFCILGCDFFLYVLFQWTYGEKHRKPNVDRKQRGGIGGHLRSDRDNEWRQQRN